VLLVTDERAFTVWVFAGTLLGVALDVAAVYAVLKALPRTPGRRSEAAGRA
jgi:hypothetical protein